MKPITIALGAALLLTFTSAASANCGSDRVMETKLKQHGFTEDVSTFSNTKKSQVCRALSSRTIGLEKRNEIRAALKSN